MAFNSGITNREVNSDALIMGYKVCLDPLQNNDVHGTPTFVDATAPTAAELGVTALTSGMPYFRASTGVLYVYDGSSWVNIVSTGADLDAAYNAGAAITIDATGPITLTNAQAAQDSINITNSHATGSGDGLQVTMSGAGIQTGHGINVDVTSTTASGNGVDINLSAAGITGHALNLAHSGTGNLINSTNFTVSPAGAIVSVGLNAGSGAITCSGNLSTTGSGTITSAGILTVSSGGAAITGNSTVTGDLSVTGSLSWGGATTITSSITVANAILSEATVPVATESYVARDNAGDLTLNAISGKSVHVAIAGTDVIDIAAGAVTFNDSSANVDYRFESNNLQYAIYLDGGKDSILVGDNADNSATDRLFFVSRGARANTAATNYADLWVQPAGAVTTTGVTAVVASAYFAEPNITIGANSVTVASTVYIANAPTEGGSNYALYVAAGAIGFGATATIESALTINENSADVDFRVETNGLQYALYVDGGKDSVVLGSNTDTSSADVRVNISRAARTATAATPYVDFQVAPAGAVTTAGGATTHAIIATAQFDEPNITNAGGDTITEAATLYVSGAPTEGASTANYAILSKGSISLKADASDLRIGASDDCLLRWSTADADNHALALGLGTSLAFHVCQAADIATDWNVAAASNPTLYIHGATTPATEYVAISTDETDAHLNAVGANWSFEIGGTPELTIDTTDVNLKDNSLVGSTAAHTADTANGCLYLASTTDAAAGFVCIKNAELGLIVGSDGSVDRATTPGTNAIHIFNGTNPAGTLTNGVSIYANAGELYTMDAAGNALLNSPHSDDGDVILHSFSPKKNRTVRVHLEKLLRKLIGNDPSLAQFIEETVGQKHNKEW